MHTTLDDKPVDSLNESDLQRLIETETTEGQHFDFKLGIGAIAKDKWVTSFKELPDEKKPEFFADISSFANAEGGSSVRNSRRELCREGASRYRLVKS